MGAIHEHNMRILTEKLEAKDMGTEYSLYNIIITGPVAYEEIPLIWENADKSLYWCTTSQKVKMILIAVVMKISGCNWCIRLLP